MHNLENILKKVAHNMKNTMDTESSSGLTEGITYFENWEWTQGVGLYGLYKYYRVTKDKEILNELISWYENAFKRGVPERNVNTTAPMLTLAFLYEETGEKKYLEACSEWAEWVMKEMPRTSDMGLQHIVTGYANDQQLWDDTLYMTVLFLAKMGALLGREDYIAESERQFLVHIKYLFDKKTGLWFHGWDFNRMDNFGEALWGRGNCWFTAGVVDYLEITNISGGTKQFLIDTLKNQVDALIKYQNENGMWNTLINDPASYQETSCTAGFGYGILKGVRLGYLPENYKEAGSKALSAVLKNIDEEGNVHKVSSGTPVWDDLNLYKTVPVCYMPYGNALSLLIINEGLKV